MRGITENQLKWVRIMHSSLNISLAVLARAYKFTYLPDVSFDKASDMLTFLFKAPKRANRKKYSRPPKKVNMAESFERIAKLNK